MRDDSSPDSGGTRFLACDGTGCEMGRWEAIEPFAIPGTWEGRVRLTDEAVTQVDLCGHLHESPAAAGQCARSLAARLNAESMPPDHAGDPTGRSRSGLRSRRGRFLRLAG